MFGYITVDRAELKGKHLDRYRAFYCGVCRDLKERCGECARMTLTYDMTFLAILLTGLYEGRAEVDTCKCILHPGKKQPVIRNEYTAYAADMNLILVYHNLEDDWRDEKKLQSFAAARALRGPYLRLAGRYPRQIRAIRRYLRALHAIEAAGVTDMEQAACETGTLMAEIFCMQEDSWSDELREIGYYLGKFIYLMDAYDDVEKDREIGNYNVFAPHAEDADFEASAAGILTAQASRAAAAFEKLPILEEVDILRNIMYSGVWVKYREKKEKEEQKSDDRSI